MASSSKGKQTLEDQYASLSLQNDDEEEVDLPFDDANTEDSESFMLSFYQNLFSANTDLSIPLDKDKKRRRKESDGSEEAEASSSIAVDEEHKGAEFDRVDEEDKGDEFEAVRRWV
nr:hypothetical protein Iba_chr09eCG10980 [Ipomoea batatas]